MIVLTLLLVQPEMKQLGMPPPCLAQSPLRTEGVVQPDTEHGVFLLPPCFLQCDSFSEFSQTSGAACSLALSVRAMLLAEAACVCKRAAAFSLAHLLAATAVP